MHLFVGDILVYDPTWDRMKKDQDAYLSYAIARIVIPIIPSPSAASSRTPSLRGGVSFKVSRKGLLGRDEAEALKLTWRSETISSRLRSIMET
jgi:hypothetical protein